jgi:D-alanyl-D-alanine carboxypeptidase
MRRVMRRIPVRSLAAVVAAAAFSTTIGLPSQATAGGSRTSPFRGSVSPISEDLARQMTGVSWHRGCPVGLADLRAVRATYHGFDGGDRVGTLIVDRDVASRVLTVLRRLYAEGFPIRRMVPVDAYGGSDYRSIEADNTSAFNCRYVDGTTRWSEHAYGRAIDVNPIENPYVTSAGTTSHAASRPYLRRTPFRPGMAAEGHALVRAFDAVGFGWGGRWSGAKDYQHFSASGR